MNSMFTLQTRRTFLKNALCVTAGAAFVPGCGMGGPPSVTEVTGFLVELLRYPEEAGKIGGSYIGADKAIDSLSPQQLTQVILAEIGVDNLDTPGVSLEEIGDKVKNKVRQDFADETVVTVNGWLLSQTEARICALVHLYRISNS